MSKTEMDRRKVLILLGAISCAPALLMQSSCVPESTQHPLQGLNTRTLQYIEASLNLADQAEKRLLEVKQIIADTQTSINNKVLQLNKMIQSDYKQNNTIDLFGWKISRTEASLFVIANTLNEDQNK